MNNDVGERLEHRLGASPLVESAGADGVDRVAWLLGGATGAAVVMWALASFAVPQIQFAVLAPSAAVGVEAAAGLSRLFGALVLSLFPADPVGRRLRWVATGFGVLGLGGLLFGFLQPLLFGALDLNTSIYAALTVRSTAYALFVIGLVPMRTPRFSSQAALVSLAALLLLSLAVVSLATRLPPLVGPTDLEAAVAIEAASLPGLTAWHWALSLASLALVILAAYGAARHIPHGTLSRWLLVALVLAAGSQLHTMFWPSAYSPVLTTADLLRLLFAAVVAVGGVFELRRIAAERAALLAVAHEHSRRLNELAQLKADFSAMVAHELSSPLAAIRGLAAMITTREIDPAAQAQAVETIRAEAEMLTALVKDVQVAATVERNDFAVRLRPVPLGQLLNEAAAFAATLPGDHPVMLHPCPTVTVLADADRVAQILHNLLSNAAKYSPPGAPIELRADALPERVRIAVADRGQGIHPDDLGRIFEKFGRGRDALGHKVPGVGLGLYLSRRIAHAHGSELYVESELGKGSTFAFELRTSP